MTEPTAPIVSPKTKLIRSVEDNLSKLLTQQAEAMPKGFNQTRFLQNCLSVLNDTQDIDKCSPVSVARTMLKGAYLGLDFFRRECYAIPYGDKLNFQTDYKGEIKVISRHSVKKIKDVYAKLVREGDVLEMGVIDGRQTLNFTPKNFNDGEIQGAFAVVYFEDGSMSCDAMSIKEIEQVRNSYSKAPKSPAWMKSYGEMCKKTVIRRLCKMISIEFDNIEQAKAFDEGGDAQFTTAPKTPAEKPFVEDPLDPKSSPIDIQATPETAATPIPPPLPAPTPTTTPRVDPDAKLRKELRELHPNATEWDLDDLVAEAKKKAAK